jgi:hypothetical protein
MLNSIHTENDTRLHYSATNFHSTEEALRDRYGKRYEALNFSSFNLVRFICYLPQVAPLVWLPLPGWPGRPSTVCG